MKATNINDKINFWAPIEFKKVNDNNDNAEKNLACRIFEAAEAYLSPTLKNRCSVTLRHGHATAFYPKTSSHWAKTALKVASYFTVVLPVIALVIKCVMRQVKFGAFRPNYEQLKNAKMFKPLSKA